MTKLWLEAWTRPGDASFGQLDPDVPVRRCSYTQRLNGVGEADAIIPDTYDISTLFDSDPDTPANSKSCLFRIMAEDHVGPVADWIPSYRALEQDARDPDQEIPGQGIESILSYARTEPFDWDGQDDQRSLFPDWIWGGRNVLGDISARLIPEVVTLEITGATGGTFTITVNNDDGIQTTGNIAWNATANDIAVALLALSNVTSIEVDGTTPGPFEIQFADDYINYIISANSAGLTPAGADAVITNVQQSSLRPAGWTESNISFLSNLPHGELVEFRMWTTGDPAAPAGCTTDQIFMFNGTEWAFPGVQKVQNVKPGGLYQAHAWITAITTGEVVRFVIRDLAENLIGQDEQTITTGGTFQEFNIANVQIPDNVDQVIVRVGHVGPGDPSRIFVGCPTLREGMPAASPGEILDALYQDAVSNHLADGRLVWDDGTGATPYLTLDFTDLLDSDGQAWTDTELSLTIKRGMSYLGAIGELAKLGYEFRVVADNWETGTYLLQVYNNGTLGTDYTAADSPSIEGGRDDIRRDVRVFQPPFTDVAVEGADQNFGRARNASLLAALGRIEGYKPEQDLGSLLEVAQAADAYAANANAETLSLSYTLSPGAGHDIPLVDYVVGDLLRVQDPPISMNRRIALAQVVFGSENTEYVVQAGTASYVGQLAIAEAVRILTAEFKAIRREPPQGFSEIYQALAGGGGGTPTVVVAAADASAHSKARADLICLGADDDITYNAALDIIFNEGPTVGGRIVLTEGNFYFRPGQVIVTDRVHLSGIGAYRTIIHNQGAGTSSSRLIEVQTTGEVSELRIITEDSYAGHVIHTSFGRVRQIGHTGPAATGVFIVGGHEPMGDWGLDGNYTDAAIVADEGSFALSNITSIRDITAGGGSFMRITGAAQTPIVLNNVAVVHSPGVGDGIVVEDAGELVITGFSISTPGNAAIATNGNAGPFRIVATGGFLQGDYGVHVLAIDGIAFSELSSMVILADLIGLNIESSSRCRFSDITVYQPGEHGVFLDNATENTLTNVVVYQPGRDTTNTFDGFNIDGNRNWLTGCRIIPATTGNLARYGVNIVAGDCNVVVGNMLGDPADYGTDALGNTGTNTQLFWPADATYGDNLTACISS